MKLVKSINVKDTRSKKELRFFQGDLTKQAIEKFDLLIISSFENDYTPTPNSLIGALSTVGVSIEDLAREKQFDLRNNFSCWLSKEIQHPNLCFKYILCFETERGYNPAHFITKIFQALLSSILVSSDIRSIALPILSTGDQGFDFKQMLFSILSSSLNWMKAGLDVESINLVEKSQIKTDQIINLLPEFAEQYRPISKNKPEKQKYDIFLSYSHKNIQEMEYVYNELKALQPDLKVFIDHKDLNTGSSWQQEIYEAIDNSKIVVSLISPTYLDSDVCKEEYNIAVFRHRESANDVLVPIYLYKSDLPTYMKLIQYQDCREFGKKEITLVCKQITEMLQV